MNTKTITLTGEETAVRFDKNYPYFWVRNFGNNDVYMSDSPGIVPGADGVVTVPAGGGASSGDVAQTGTMYFLGSGEIEVSPQFNAVCPFFNPKQKGGDSGGSSSDYTLPVASVSKLGGVKSGGDISVSSAGAVTVNSVGGKTVKADVPADAKFTDTVYTLPAASTETLGGVKVDGSTISADANGVISAVGGGSGGDDNVIESIKVNGVEQTVNADKSVDITVPAPPAKVSELENDSGYITAADIPSSLPANGGNADTVNNHTVNTDVPENAVFTDTVYTLPAATADTLGGVKPDGTTITVTPDGTISSANSGGSCIGEITEGKEFTIDGTSVIASAGATRLHIEANNIATGRYSLAIGSNTKATNNFTFAAGSNVQATGAAAIAMGTYPTKASGDYSMALGYTARAEGDYSIAIGPNATATGEYSRSIGGTASGKRSISMCYGIAQGEASIAMLSGTTQGYGSISAGLGTVSTDYNIAIGRYNKTPASASASNTTAGDLFIVGNGHKINNTEYRSNTFRIAANSYVYGTRAYTASGADICHAIEWLDGNPDNEDRRGLFVTLDGDKIRLANTRDTYILGVVSANPSLVCNAATDDWHNKWKTDVFGERILVEKTDENGNVYQTWELNEDFREEDNENYVSRLDRKEWATIGHCGILVAVDDGTCKVNSYCMPNDNGVATAAETGYRVMKRLDETHIEIFVSAPIIINK